MGNRVSVSSLDLTPLPRDFSASFRSAEGVQLFQADLMARKELLIASSIDGSTCLSRFSVPFFKVDMDIGFIFLNFLY